MAHFIVNPSPTTLHPFTASQAVAAALRPGDLVVNLNYDTVFEIGLKQARVDFRYIPGPPERRHLYMAKPHASINLVCTASEGRWTDPEHFQTVTYPDEDMTEFRGIVPPRFNKSFEQHPIAAAVCELIRRLFPESLTFWGVSLADSDRDLLDLYREWSRSLSRIELIHPNPTAEAKANIQRLLGKAVKQFLSPEEWASEIRSA